MFNLIPLSYEGEFIEITSLFRVLFPILTLVFVVGLFFLVPTKSKKATKITKITIASFLIIMYLIKIIFNVLRAYLINAENHNVERYLKLAFGLDIPSIMIILSCVVLFISAFSNKEFKFVEFLNYSLLGVGLPSAFISLFSTNIISLNDNYYHILNIISMLFNTALIFIPLYLLKTKDIKINMLNFWYAIAGYICALSICMTLSLVIREGNFSEMTYSQTLASIGIRVNFPWHLLIIIPIFLIISFVITYILSKIFKKYSYSYSNENFQAKDSQLKKNDFFDLYAFATKTVCCMQGFLILFILAAIIRNPYGSLWGIFCLIPLIMTLFCLFATFEMEKQALINDENIFNKDNKIAKKIITYVFLGNFIFGFSFMGQIKNERESIVERKQREEKRKNRMLNNK